MTYVSGLRIIWHRGQATCTRTKLHFFEQSLNLFSSDDLNMGTDVALVSGVRTAIGEFGGSLKDFPAADLGALVVRETLSRVAAINGGVAQHTPALMVSRLCGSGLEGASATMFPDHQEAPIFTIADYGLVGDLFVVVSEFAEIV